MRFEWDPQKAEKNRRKHGLSFEEAILAFDDPCALIVSDVKMVKSEERFLLIGDMDRGAVVVVFTKRGEATRIISARPASRSERRMYETIKNIPL